MSSDYEFLTGLSRRRFSKTSPMFLYVNVLSLISNSKLFCTIHHTLGNLTTQIYNIGELSVGVKILDVSYATAAYDSRVIGTIKSIDFFINTGPSITLYPYTPKGDNTLVIYYQNSLGGLDSVICEGDQAPSLETEGYEVELAQSYDSNITDNQQYSYEQEGMRESMTVTAIGPKNEILALKDLYLWKNAFVIENDQWIPIIIQGQSYALPTAKTNIYKQQITFKYAHKELAIDRII
jgi:hypothetical protein